MPIESYLQKFEKEERSKCKAVNLSLLNEALESDDEDFGEVGEEYEKEEN